MTRTERVILALAVMLAIALFFATGSQYKKYVLPDGTVAYCETIRETERGNYILTDCKDGTTYYVHTYVQEKPGEYN